MRRRQSVYVCECTTTYTINQPTNQPALEIGKINHQAAVILGNNSKVVYVIFLKCVLPVNKRYENYLQLSYTKQKNYLIQNYYVFSYIMEHYSIF